MKSISMKIMTCILAVAMMMGMTTGVFASGLTAGDIADADTTDGTYNVYEPTAGEPVVAGDASAVIVVDIEPTILKAVVPIALYVSQNVNGEITCKDAMTAENATGTAKIINESAKGPIITTDVKVIAAPTYELTDWNADYDSMLVNSKKFGFKINGLEAQTDGTVVSDNDVSDTITTTVKNSEDGKTDLTRVYGDYNITPSGDSAFPVISHGSVLPIDYEAKLPAYSDEVDNVKVGAVVFTVDFKTAD